MAHIPAGSDQMRAHRRVVAKRAMRVAKTELREETKQLVSILKQFMCRTVIPDSERGPLERCADRVSDLLLKTEE